jgi:hypothetical protein
MSDILTELIKKLGKETGMRMTGSQIDQEVVGAVQRQIADRRFSTLAAAVREHEARAGAQRVGARPHDLALYRRLRRISAAA